MSHILSHRPIAICILRHHFACLPTPLRVHHIQSASPSLLQQSPPTCPCTNPFSVTLNVTSPLLLASSPPKLPVYQTSCWYVTFILTSPSLLASCSPTPLAGVPANVLHPGWPPDHHLQHLPPTFPHVPVRLLASHIQAHLFIFLASYAPLHLANLAVPFTGMSHSTQLSIASCCPRPRSSCLAWHSSGRQSYLRQWDTGFVFTLLQVPRTVVMSPLYKNNDIFTWHLQPPPPTLPMYRSHCWCISRPSPTTKSVVCIPPVYVIGVEKCGTVGLIKGIRRHPLVEKANSMEQRPFTGNLQYVKKTLSKVNKSSLCISWQVVSPRSVDST